MTIAWIALALVLGVAIGWYAGRRRRSEPEELTPESTRMTVAQLNQVVLRESPTGMVVVDEHRDVVSYNLRAEDFGLVREQLLDDRVWVAAARALRSGEPVDVELTVIRRSDRAQVAVRCHVEVVRSPLDRDESYAVVYADDDTENQRVEATRRDFVANVSHELKTPVGAIGLLAEALLESVDDEEAVRHFGARVLRESNRMGNMVNELIALSRLQGAERLPDLDRVEVDDVVGEAVTRAQVSAEASDIDLVVDEASGMEVLGDDTLLLTALSNLIANAIAYSPQHTAVSISRRRRAVGAKTTVEIAVTDRGLGIAPEDQERVFERFFRVDKARSRVTGGTGLGLAIVKHVAANHGGSIKLWSKPGMGSTFTLVLPAADPETSQDSGEMTIASEGA